MSICSIPHQLYSVCIGSIYDWRERLDMSSPLYTMQGGVFGCCILTTINLVLLTCTVRPLSMPKGYSTLISFCKVASSCAKKATSSTYSHNSTAKWLMWGPYKPCLHAISLTISSILSIHSPIKVDESGHPCLCP